jgi:hypothetical protein
MISLRKLDTLSEGTRRRKIPIILRDIERRLLDGDSCDRTYLKGLMRVVTRDGFWTAEVRETAGLLAEKTPEELLRAVNELKHGTLRGLGRNWGGLGHRDPAGRNPRNKIYRASESGLFGRAAQSLQRGFGIQNVSGVRL